MEAIENKVAKSGLITLNLEDLKPDWSIVGLDISTQLVEGLMLREKDFRAFISDHDWTAYKGKHVFVHCSTEAIVPTWAYMLISSALSEISASCRFGSKAELQKLLWLDVVECLDYSSYQDERVIVKGCSNEVIDESVYMLLATKLTPIVKSLMFGEPCSTVPIYKKK
ncbi:DUF2480 family protein [bacterium]|jgi:hypothetical protein|nr:DUF2480 family protein [bacterium]